MSNVTRSGDFVLSLDNTPVGITIHRRFWHSALQTTAGNNLTQATSIV